MTFHHYRFIISQLWLISHPRSTVVLLDTGTPGTCSSFLDCRPFFKEFRVVGQICREGMDESGILSKARYAMTVCHCPEQPLVLWGGGGGEGGGAVSQGRAVVGFRRRSVRKLQSTQYQKMPPKTTSLVHFICVLQRKNSFKLKKFMCKVNISTSWSVNISKRISW